MINFNYLNHDPYDLQKLTVNFELRTVVDCHLADSIFNLLRNRPDQTKKDSSRTQFSIDQKSGKASTQLKTCTLKSVCVFCFSKPNHYVYCFT